VVLDRSESTGEQSSAHEDDFTSDQIEQYVGPPLRLLWREDHALSTLPSTAGAGQSNRPGRRRRRQLRRWGRRPAGRGYRGDPHRAADPGGSLPVASLGLAQTFSNAVANLDAEEFWSLFLLLLLGWVLHLDQGGFGTRSGKGLGRQEEREGSTSVRAR
jgi:hypothetical protein